MKKVLNLFFAMSFLLPLLAKAQTGGNKVADSAYVPDMEFDNVKIDPKAFAKKVNVKVNKLTDYFEILVAKKDPHYKDAIDQAMELFNKNENRIVTITTSGTEKVEKKPIKKYLISMADLPYSSVSIKWNKMQYVSKFKKAPDGSWYGTVIFEQEFKGYDAEKKLTYDSRTQKAVNIQVLVWDFMKNGKVQLGWDVFFSDIAVVKKA